MINRFRIVMTLVAAGQAALVGMMAYATQISYSIPPALAIGATGMSIFLGIIAVQMPSWQSSEAVSKAATNAEKP